MNEAMSLLGIDHTGLQTLVARGDLQAYRKSEKMVFYRADVIALKAKAAEYNESRKK